MGWEGASAEGCMLLGAEAKAVGYMRIAGCGMLLGLHLRSGV